MGFFQKKPKRNKIYSLTEAMNFVKQDPNYTVIQTTNGYRVIHDQIARAEIEQYKTKISPFKEQQENFRNRIQERGINQTSIHYEIERGTKNQEYNQGDLNVR